MTIKICLFSKFYNDRENLERMLSTTSKYVDYMVLCDDSSNDGSREVAEKYTKDIITMPNVFTDELSHKQKLLEFAREKHPDITHFIHLDSDEILDITASEGLKRLCEFGEMFGFDSFAVHLINLWGSPCWVRVDSQFNDLTKVPIWENSPDLKFDTSEGLHRPQQPMNLKRCLKSSIQILHYGFSDFNSIARKYSTYKRHGQSGNALDRLRPDNPNIQLVPMNLSLFPADLKPRGEPQKIITTKEFDELCQKYQ